MWVVTFTRTAANDLRREIQDLNIAGSEKIIAGTLHSHATRILLEQQELDASGRFSRLLIEHEVQALLWDLANPDFGTMTDKKNRLKDFESAWAVLQSDEPGWPTDPIDKQFEIGLRDWLSYFRAMLIGEVIPLALAHLRDNPLTPAKNAFDHVLVDEFQDLNKAEQELIRELRGDSSIVVVGDDDQSIYGFKNARPEGIREVPEVYSPCDLIEFTECRRCPRLVVELAANLISNNPDRTLGRLRPMDGNPEGDVLRVQWNDLTDEIDGLARIIASSIEGGQVEPGDVLVLTPRRRIGYRLRGVLTDLGIPVRSYFRENALSSTHVRHTFSLLNLIAYPNDAVALRYLLGWGSQNGRAKEFAKLRAVVGDSGSLRNTLEKCLSDNTFKGVSHLLKRFSHIEAETSRLKGMLISGGMTGFEEYVDDLEHAQDHQDLVELLRAILPADPIDEAQFETLFPKMFDDARTVVTFPEYPTEVDHVRIMSLHASKGLSSPFVVITSVVNRIIPSSPDAPDPDDLQEQRRLFYVATTRCKTSKGGYPGTLVLSSFLRMGIRDIGTMNLDPGKGTRFNASLFFSDMGPALPAAVSGYSYLNQLTKHSAV